MPAWGLRPATLLEMRLWYRFFPANFAKFLRTPFLQNTLGRLLLSVGNILGLFSRLFNLSLSTSFLGNLLWIRCLKKIQCFKIFLLERKQVRSTKISFYNFLLKLCLLFFFVCLLKAYCFYCSFAYCFEIIWCLMFEWIWKDLIFEWLQFFNYIKVLFTGRITIIGYSIPRHFSWFTNDL